MISCSVSRPLVPDVTLLSQDDLMGMITEVQSVGEIDLEALPRRFAAAVDLDETAMSLELNGMGSRSFIDWSLNRASRCRWSQSQIVDLHFRAARLFRAHAVEPETRSVLTALKDRAEVFFYLTARSPRSIEFTGTNLREAQLPLGQLPPYTIRKK